MTLVDAEAEGFLLPHSEVNYESVHFFGYNKNPPPTLTATSTPTSTPTTPKRDEQTSNNLHSTTRHTSPPP